MKVYDQAGTTVDETDIKPDYYGTGPDVIDFLYDHFGDETSVFMVGNIIKYVTRYREKNGRQDLIKARTYLDRMIERTEANGNGV